MSKELFSKSTVSILGKAALMVGLSGQPDALAATPKFEKEREVQKDTHAAASHLFAGEPIAAEFQEKQPAPQELKDIIDVTKQYVFKGGEKAPNIQTQLDTFFQKYSDAEREKNGWDPAKEILNILEDTFGEPDFEAMQARACEMMGKLGSRGKGCLGRLATLAALADTQSNQKRKDLSKAAQTALPQIGAPTQNEVVELAGRVANRNNNDRNKEEVIKLVFQNLDVNFQCDFEGMLSGHARNDAQERERMIGFFTRTLQTNPFPAHTERIKGWLELVEKQ